MITVVIKKRVKDIGYRIVRRRKGKRGR